MEKKKTATKKIATPTTTAPATTTTDKKAAATTTTAPTDKKATTTTTDKKTTTTTKVAETTTEEKVVPEATEDKTVTKVVTNTDKAATTKTDDKSKVKGKNVTTVEETPKLEDSKQQSKTLTTKKDELASKATSKAKLETKKDSKAATTTPTTATTTAPVVNSSTTTAPTTKETKDKGVKELTKSTSKATISKTTTTKVETSNINETTNITKERAEEEILNESTLKKTLDEQKNTENQMEESFIKKVGDLDDETQTKKIFFNEISSSDGFDFEKNKINNLGFINNKLKDNKFNNNELKIVQVPFFNSSNLNYQDNLCEGYTENFRSSNNLAKAKEDFLSVDQSTGENAIRPFSVKKEKSYLLKDQTYQKIDPMATYQPTYKSLTNENVYNYSGLNFSALSIPKISKFSNPTYNQNLANFNNNFNYTTSNSQNFAANFQQIKKSLSPVVTHNNRENNNLRNSMNDHYNNTFTAPCLTSPVNITISPIEKIEKRMKATFDNFPEDKNDRDISYRQVNLNPFCRMNQNHHLQYLKSLKQSKGLKIDTYSLCNPANSLHRVNLLSPDLAFELDYKDVLEKQKLKVGENREKQDKLDNQKLSFRQKALITEKRIALGKNPIIQTFNEFSLPSVEQRNFVKEKNIHMTQLQTKKIGMSTKGAQLMLKLNGKINGLI